MVTGIKEAKLRAPRNRTIELRSDEIGGLRSGLFFDGGLSDLDAIRDSVICGDAFEILPKLAKGRFDLLFADPPYNLTKDFGSEKFTQRSSDEYEEWLDAWLS